MGKNYFLLLSIISLFINFSCSKEVVNIDNINHVDNLQDANYADDRLMILVSEDLAEMFENANSTKKHVSTIITTEELQGNTIKSVKRIFPFAGRFEARTRAEGLHLWYEVEIGENTALAVARQGFIKTDGIRLVERKLIPRIKYSSKPAVNTHDKASNSKASPIFNDPKLNQQWHYKNNGVTENFVKGADVNIMPVWEEGVVGNPEIIVAIVDGGIDLDHEDLVDNIYVNQAELNGVAGFDDDDNGFIDDINGYNHVKLSSNIIPSDHGTHVAGTVAAMNNNGVGVSGVAGGNGKKNTGVKLLSSQIFIMDENGSDNGEYNTSSNGVKYGADAGAIISHNSWGYSAPEIPQYEKDGIDYFIKYAGVDENGIQTGPLKGGIVVFSAGNASASYSSPGSYNALCVTAIGPDSKKPEYSNFGDFAHITAPGGNGDKWDINIGGVLSTLNDNKYGYLTGTSMSAPHVSGIIALYISKMISENKHIGLTPKMVIERLLSTTRSIEDLEPIFASKLGKGSVDAARFVGINTTTVPGDISNLAIKDFSVNSISINWTVAADVKGHKIFYSKDKLTSLDPKNPGDNVTVIDYGNNPLEGDILEYTIKNLDVLTKYYFAVVGWDYADNMSNVSNIASVSTLDNLAPVFEDEKGEVVTQVSEIILKGSETRKLIFTLKDPEGEIVETEHTKGSDAESVTYNKSTKKVIVFINGTRANAGTYTAKIIARDNYNKESILTISYTIESSPEPTIIKEFDDMSIVGLNKEISYDLLKFFSIEDNSKLDFDVNIDNQYIISYSLSGSDLVILSKNVGSSKVTITATNLSNKSVSTHFDISVENNAPPVVDNQTVTLYPNPLKDVLNIKTNAEKIDAIAIYNSLGALVLEAKNISGKQLNVSSLKSGIYSVDVTIAKKLTSRKIFKQ